MAGVVLDDDVGLLPEQVIAATRTLLAGYKTPKQVLVLDELPLTVNGKPDRKALARRLAG